MKLEKLKEIFNDNIIKFENVKCELINNCNQQLDKLKNLKKIIGQVNFDEHKNEFQIIANDDIYIRFKILSQKNTKDLVKNINHEMYNLSELTLHTSITDSQDDDNNIYLTTYFFKLKNNRLLELESLNIKDEDDINNFIIYTKDKDDKCDVVTKNYYFLYTIMYKLNKPNFILLGKGERSIILNIKTRLNKHNIEEEYIEYNIFNDEVKINNNNIYIGYFNSKVHLNNKNNIVAIKNILNNENSDYLNVWGKYISKEGDALLNHAKKVGIINVNSSDITLSHQDSVYIVSTNPKDKEKLKYLKVGDSLLQVINTEVSYIKEELNWEEYCIQNKKNKKNKKNKGYIIEKIDNNLIYLKTDGDKLKITNKHLEDIKIKFILNIQGSESQIKRRESAKENIQNRANSMSNLYDLLEGKISTTNTLNNKINNSNLILTPYVKEKIFKNNKPTSTQLEAIKIAINTPDIAVIQGPPGTGKSTVITAILEALNENYDKTENISGNILITSYQHDAVENIIQKLQINALPTIKFGKSSKHDNNDFNMDNFVKKWGEDLIKGVKAKNINLKSIEETQKLKEIIEFYKNSPTLENENKFLYYSKDLISRVSSNKELLNFINYTIEYTNIELNANTSQNLLKQVLNLRVTKAGFQDDGAINAFKLYYTLRDDRFKNIKNKKYILKLLYSAYNKYQNVTTITDDDDFNKILKKLEQIRTYLLEKLKPKPLYIPPQINQDILNLYTLIEKELKLLEKEPKDLIIYEYIESLENNINIINNALTEYTTVFASTIQQTLSKKIYDIKIPENKNNVNKIPVYDTVIIDEAARANPGDLMIALMQAKNKIILVGDHRQLPHMYEESILDEVVSDDQNKQSITQSLFERLIEIVKELEKKDYNKRFITLNTQYRMPKTLGNFISNNFYKHYNENFDSPIDDKNLTDYLTLMPSCANWINVPIRGILEEKSKEKLNGSYKRNQEIEVIIEKIQELLSTETGKNLTYGIISFYKAQVLEIKKYLPKELKNKVRVGSVDAFQGLEFDVIFLSTVRTSYSLSEYSGDKEKIYSNEIQQHNKELLLDNLKQSYARKIFGFLLMENRLCVAMSRQKKFLIVVGDLELFKSEFSQEFVPAMYNFYKLCEETGGVIY